MRFPLILISLSAMACAAPAWHQGPIISDDDNLMERRDIVKVEIVEAHTSRFTNTIVTKITRYATDAASDVQGFLTESFRGAVADGNGEVMTVSFGKKVAPFMINPGRGKGRGGRHHHRHRISLLGFRNRLAVFILAFSLVLAVACSYLRRAYVASLQKPVDSPALDTSLAEKALSRSDRLEETTKS
ncbi:hypothetical protein VFPPC_08531 [Pochonia chlamydosporia 170]|uniref:Uncharacterized protein n=1 Tax=Pochonia chlamydosporia 170 TaxID=1380566 RepID=A0A179FPY1_METCM|nr:hypothetical protein VFPPC_08531 [Pochonia chlamydosporia 170]OAQ67069.1 hypothetical protein VFPPC_08531 [Pochonia chlamydosporia 170]